MNDVLRIARLKIALQRAFLGRAIIIFTFFPGRPHICQEDCARSLAGWLSYHHFLPLLLLAGDSFLPIWSISIISILSIYYQSHLCFYLYQQPYQLIFSSTRLPLRWRTWRHNRQWWRKGREHSRKNLPSLKNLLPYWIFTWESMREAKVTLSKSCIGLKEMEEGYWSHKAQSISKYAFSGQQPLW